MPKPTNAVELVKKAAVEAVEAVDQQAGFSLYQVCVICLLFGILVFLMVAWISRKKDR